MERAVLQFAEHRPAQLGTAAGTTGLHEFFYSMHMRLIICYARAI